MTSTKKANAARRRALTERQPRWGGRFVEPGRVALVVRGQQAAQEEGGGVRGGTDERFRGPLRTFGRGRGRRPQQSPTDELEVNELGPEEYEGPAQRGVVEGESEVESGGSSPLTPLEDEVEGMGEADGNAAVEGAAEPAAATAASHTWPPREEDEARWRAQIVTALSPVTIGPSGPPLTEILSACRHWVPLGDIVDDSDEVNPRPGELDDYFDDFAQGISEGWGRWQRGATVGAGHSEQLAESVGALDGGWAGGDVDMGMGSGEVWDGEGDMDMGNGEIWGGGNDTGAGVGMENEGDKGAEADAESGAEEGREQHKDKGKRRAPARAVRGRRRVESPAGSDGTPSPPGRPAAPAPTTPSVPRAVDTATPVTPSPRRRRHENRTEAAIFAQDPSAIDAERPCLRCRREGRRCLVPPVGIGRKCYTCTTDRCTLKDGEPSASTPNSAPAPSHGLSPSTPRRPGERVIGPGDFAVTQELAALARSPGSGRLRQHAINELRRMLGENLAEWGFDDLDDAPVAGGSRGE